MQSVQLHAELPVRTGMPVAGGKAGPVLSAFMKIRTLKRSQSSVRRHPRLRGSKRDEQMRSDAPTVAPTEVTVLEFPADPRPGVKSSGLNSTPHSGGVENATRNCGLPSPAVAVRNLVEQAQFAHLCTIMANMHHRRAGYPFGTIVDFAADGAGYPIFALSPLAIQTRNLLEDPRCSLVMQMPGWQGLANARVTIFGDVYKLPKEMHDAAESIFHEKKGGKGRPRELRSNAVYFRMNRIIDIYFVGGFGTVQWVGEAEYSSASPDAIVVSDPAATLHALNAEFSAPLREVLSGIGKEGGASGAADDAAFISIDKLGADVRVRRGGQYLVERIAFGGEVSNLPEAAAAVRAALERHGATMPAAVPAAAGNTGVGAAGREEAGKEATAK